MFKKINITNCDGEPLEITVKHESVGLIAGSHEIPNIGKYIFDEPIKDIKDTKSMEDIARRRIDELSMNYILFLDLHVTSLTPVLIATLNACRDRIIDVYIKLCYYDKKTDTFFTQMVR